MLLGKKFIADPVHGTVGLTEVEARVLESGSFQRLRHVRQLGLANYVYPGAGYSRFEHSVGACHLAGRVLETLRLSGVELDDRLIQKYRLAALLHDIGHYPFSHATEHALESNYSESLVTDKGGSATPKLGKIQPEYYKHESVGGRVLEHDQGINDALRAADFTPSEIEKVFRRELPDEMTSIVSSDLDVDRLDYLLRTAHATGLPYGQVDVGYLVSQMRLDKERRVCLSAKAMRAAEHLLLARYFDYRQVAYHKTVVGFELALQKVLNRMVSKRSLALSKTAVDGLIKDGLWGSFHDASMLERIRAFGVEQEDPVTKALTSCVLNRRPAVLLFEEERLAPRDEKTAFKRTKQCLMRVKGTLGTKHDIPQGQVEVWDKATRLTKMGSKVPIEALDEPESDDSGQMVRIMNPDGTSEFLVTKQQSLMRALSQDALYTLRLYWFPQDDQRGMRREVQETTDREVESELG